METGKETELQRLWSLLKKNRLAFSGLVILCIFFIIAAAGLILTSGRDPVFDPSIVRLQDKLRPPFSKVSKDIISRNQWPPFGIYIFGTDDLGRDVFSRMLQGAWVSLSVGFVAVGISVIIGIIVGGVSGYYGRYMIKLNQIIVGVFMLMIMSFLIYGSIILASLFFAGLVMVIWLSKRYQYPILIKEMVSLDSIIMRFVDIMLCFPSFFLILTVVALLPSSIYNIMVVIGLTSWMGTARFVRAEFLSLREQDFVFAAKALGIKDWRIIFRHMLPNAIAPVMVSATIGIASAILTEAGLSFLGFGVPPPFATWGNILSDGKRYIFDAPWLTFIPGVAILVVVLAFNLFGEGLRDVINPRLRESV